MASENSRLAYNHIVRVLLDAADGTPIDVLLRGEGITKLRKLRQYLRKPGLAVVTYTDSEGTEHDLSDEQYEDLQAMHSYLNWLQNNYGPISESYYDITSRSRADFEIFIGVVYKGITIDYDEQKAIQASRQRRQQRTQSQAPSATATVQTPAPAATPKSAVTTWMKGVKRNASAFPELVKDYHFNLWRRNTLATAHAQQVLRQESHAHHRL